MSDRAAFFDMDRTLVRKNTGTLYAQWRFREKQASVLDMIRVARWVLEYSFGVVDVSEVTRRALRDLIGVEEHVFRTQCERWYEGSVRQWVSQRARDVVGMRKSEGYVCAILSASTPYAVAPLASELGIDHVLCTRLTIDAGKFTGAYEEPLCYGAGKVAIAERWAELHGIDLARSVFYTDSVSDLPMLERVGQPFVVNPDPRLRLAATLRRWPIERWV